MSEEQKPEGIDEAADVAAEAAIAANQIMVVTTAPGVFGIEGVAPVGTKRAIHPKAFSSAWMRPATQADRKKLDKARAKESDA